MALLDAAMATKERDSENAAGEPSLASQNPHKAAAAKC